MTTFTYNDIVLDLDLDHDFTVDKVETDENGNYIYELKPSILLKSKLSVEYGIDIDEPMFAAMKETVFQAALDMLMKYFPCFATNDELDYLAIKFVDQGYGAMLSGLGNIDDKPQRAELIATHTAVGFMSDDSLLEELLNEINEQADDCGCGNESVECNYTLGD